MTTNAGMRFIRTSVRVGAEKSRAVRLGVLGALGALGGECCL